MHQHPPFQGRGFGFGRHMVELHGHLANTPLQWATFALVLLVALTLWALVVARIARGGGRHRHRRELDPLDVVRLRFARGEIGRDEFLQATADLAPAAPGPPPS